MSETYAPRPSRLPAFVRAMRPKQWVKNVLVLAAPIAAGQILDQRVLVQTGLAFVAFCLISASIYLVNDVRDVELDRQHPRKKFRPIAAGELSSRTAIILAVICLAGSIALAWFTSWQLTIVVALYWILQVLYSILWKNQPIIDLAMVSAGFLLRAVAGGVASGIPLSQWFLLVASFGSLFMVAGKRYSEMIQLGPDAGTRASLRHYTDTYLRFVWAIASALVIMSYSLWAFEQQSQLESIAWAQISIAPFTMAMLRYAYKVDTGAAGEPEDVVFSDRVLQLLGLLWAVTVALAVFL